MMRALLFSLTAAVHGFDWPVYWDGRNPVYLPISPMPSGLAGELVFSFSPEEICRTGWVVNATHFSIPTAAPSVVKAGYAQRMNAPSVARKRSGVSVMQVISTPVSLFPKTVAMFAHKTSITSHDGNWQAKPKADWEDANAVPPTLISDLEPTPLLEQPIGQAWFNRSALAFQVLKATKLPRSFIAALFEPNLVQALEAIHTAGVSPAESPHTQNLRSTASGLNRGAAASAVEGDQLSCWHFQRSSAIEVRSDAIVFPLSKPLVSFNGVTEWPSHLFALFAGLTTFTFDASTGVLEARVALSGEAFVRDPEWMLPEFADSASVFTVSPPDGISFPASMLDEDGQVKDGRSYNNSVCAGSCDPEPYAHALYQRLRSTPLDYSIFEIDLTPWCTSPAARAAWEDDATEVGRIVNPGAFRQALTVADTNQLVAQSEADRNISIFISSMLPCGQEYEVSNHPTRRNFVDILEMTTWGHFVLEQDYDHADRVIATITQRGWNDVSVDEAGEECQRPCPDGCVREKHGARQRHVLFASTLCPSGCVPA